MVIVVTHSLLVLRGILLDLNPTQKIRQAIDWLFTIGGAVAIGYGIWLLVVLANR